MIPLGGPRIARRCAGYAVGSAAALGLAIGFSACGTDEPPVGSGIHAVDAAPEAQPPPEVGAADAQGEPSDAQAEAEAGQSEAASDVAASDGAVVAAQACPALDVPGSTNPLDALVGIAMTETRLYVASRSAIYAFARNQSCAGARITSYADSGEIARQVVAITSAPSDGIVVADSQSTEWLDSVAAATGCGSAANVLNYDIDLLRGFASSGATVEGLVVGPTSCTRSAFGLAGRVVLAAAPDRKSSSAALVAFEPEAGSRPVIERLTGGASDRIDPGGLSCSARALVDSAIGVAVLDAECGLVRFFDAASGSVYPIPGGETGRALVAVPGTDGRELLLGSVGLSGEPPKLRVISASLPPPGGDPEPDGATDAVTQPDVSQDASVDVLDAASTNDASDGD